MIHSFTPSGVEHSAVPAICASASGVIHSFTPSGVEHLATVALSIAQPRVIHSFTPSGVEHLVAAFGDGGKSFGDSFVYAVRR